MKKRTSAMAIGVLIAAASSAVAHGPQIQITNDSNKIVTRALHLHGPYSTALTSPVSAYVMPVKPDGGVWYSRPNGELDTILHLPEFPSGPGLAYGYDLADGVGPQVFQAGTAITASFTAGLKLWNGVAFVDAGATQLKAFRGSNPDISSPDANFAVTTDVGPFDSLSLATVAGPSGGSLGYGTEGPEVHGSFRWAFLGDGTSPTSASPDGVYLLSLRLSSTQAGINPSDEYFFVLNKNVPWSTVVVAVNSLGVGASLQQWVVPEPTTIVFAVLACAGWLGVRGSRSKRGSC